MFINVYLKYIIIQVDREVEHEKNISLDNIYIILPLKNC